MFNNQIIKFFVPPFRDKSIEEFINRCYKSYEINSKPLFSFNPFLFFFIIYDEFNNPFGFIQCSLVYERIEIEQFLILEDYRGYGYGKILLQSLIDYAIEKNCCTISLEVNVNNIIAVKLYKKFGFEVVAVRKNYYCNNDDAYLMIKKVLVKIDEV